MKFNVEDTITTEVSDGRFKITVYIGTVYSGREIAVRSVVEERVGKTILLRRPIYRTIDETVRRRIRDDETVEDCIEYCMWKSREAIADVISNEKEIEAIK